MKKILLALLATSTLAIAAPALAHDDDDDWGRAPTYQSFQEQYRHIWQGIWHGLSDGSYTSVQANYFADQLRSIQRRAYYDTRSGDYDPSWTEAQLDRLHERMHIAHERGHERLDNDWNNDWNRGSNGYRSYQPYSGYYSYDYRR